MVCLLAAVSFARADEATATLEIDTASGAHRFTVEIANDPRSREIGLMNRHEMAADHGMLFEFPSREPVTFWMKDTYLPLDMVFIDRDGSVRRVVENAKPLSEDFIPSQSPVVGVLELKGGEAAKIGLKPGDKVKAGFFGN